MRWSRAKALSEGSTRSPNSVAVDLETRLTTPEEQRPDTQTVLFTKVVRAILQEKDPDVFLDAQRAAHIQRMRELTTIAMSDSLSERLTTE